VHLLPLGATEPHGPHAPLSTDTLISIGVCERAAARLRGEIDVLVLPPLPYGVTRYGSDFPGAVGISEQTLRSLVSEIAAAAGRLILVNNHFEPEQVQTLRETGYYLGRGFSTIVKSIDPRRVYVGGEITLAWDLFESAVRDALREQALIREPGEIEIRVVPLSEHPRLRGAAALVSTPAFAAPTVA